MVRSPPLAAPDGERLEIHRYAGGRAGARVDHGTMNPYIDPGSYVRRCFPAIALREASPAAR